MPIEYKLTKSPAGHEVLSTVSSGMVTDSDAATYTANRVPGGKYEKYPLLAVTAPDTQFEPQARKTFSNLPKSTYPQAIIVTNMAVRVIISFMMKMSKGSGPETRIFGSEVEGFAFIDTFMASRPKT